MTVNSVQVTDYSSTKCPGSVPVAYTLTMDADTNYVLASNGRLVIWGYEYSDTQKVNVQSISATVTPSDNAIAISNVKLTPIGDNQTDISITNGYYVHIKKHGEGDDYAVVKDAQNIQIGAGTYDVFVKYGDYTVYAEEGVVVIGTEAFDTETTINFGSNGNYTTFENLTYTSKNNDQDGESQFGYTDAGKELSFYVKAGAFIKVNSHGGAYTHYTLEINGEVSSEQTGTTYSAFTPNPTKVTILSTAADNYISSIEITYPNFVTTSKQLILGSDNTDLVDLCDEDASSNKIIQGKKVSLDGFTIDATNGKVRLNDGDNSQVNTGTKIIFFVKANSVVTVEGYPGNFAYSINGIEATVATTSLVFTEDSMVTVLATDSKYLKSISVSYPKFLSSETITFGNNSTFETAKTNFDVNSTVKTTNYDGYAQVKEGKISFVVSENTEVTIVGYYSVDYDINGTLVQGKTADELTKTFTFTEATVVTINCQTVENSYGDGNYFTSITINEK